MVETEPATSGPPVFESRTPRFNHVAMSLPAEMLDEEHRRLLVDFYSTVLGWQELAMMTEDRKRLIFQVHEVEQFVFLIADEPHMSCARLDHFGLSVGTRADLDELYRRACAYREHDDRVEIIDTKTDDHGVLKITAFYVRYLLPMMVEIQHWDYSPSAGGS